jgi:hypothetical protein
MPSNTIDLSAYRTNTPADVQPAPSDTLDLSIRQATRGNPDKAMEYNTLAKSQNLPADTVERNYPEVSARAHQQSIDTAALRRDNPATASYLSNPANAQVSIDDIDQLTGLENELKSDHGFWSNTMRGGVSRTNELVGNLLQFGGTLATDMSQSMADMGIPNPGIVINDDGISWSRDRAADSPSMLSVEGGYLSDSKAPRAGYVPDFTWEKLKGDITPSNLAGYIIEQGVKSLPDMVATIATLPAYVASRTQEIGETIATNDVRAEADTSDLMSALPTAVIVSLLEKIGAKGVFDLGAAETAKDVAKAAGEAFVKEGVTEFIQEGVEYVGETLPSRKKLSANEGFDRALAGLVAGGPMGGAIRGATATTQAVTHHLTRNSRAVAKSMYEQEKIDRIISLSQSSKTRGRGATEQMREFLDGTGNERMVHIDATIVREMVDRGVQIPDYITNQLTGEGVTISMAQFVNDVAVNEELIAELRPHIRLSNESLSSTELASGDNTTINNILQKAAKNVELKTEADAIYETVKDQLVATGRQGEATAKWSAQLYPAYATTAAEKYGISVKQAFEDMGFSVVGPAGSTPSVDSATVLTQAQTEGYEGTDTGEATEWLAAVAKGLDMTTEGRMARAVEMGFDVETTYYHGTNTDIIEFDVGADAGFRMLGDGIYLTDNATKASGYGDRVIPTFVKGRLASNDDLVRIAPKVYRDAPVRLGYSAERSMINNQLTIEGFDGIDAGQEILIFDPQNIRSINAAFDPDNAQSSNLLAQSGRLDKQIAAIEALSNCMKGK